MTPALRCATIHISGQVQGVFFRTAAKREADRLGLTGIVENLADGTVRILAEGTPERLKAFIAWCAQGPDLASVEDIRVEWDEPTGYFHSFAIRV